MWKIEGDRLSLEHDTRATLCGKKKQRRVASGTEEARTHSASRKRMQKTIRQLGWTLWRICQTRELACLFHQHIITSARIGLPGVRSFRRSSPCRSFVARLPARPGPSCFGTCFCLFVTLPRGSHPSRDGLSLTVITRTPPPTPLQRHLSIPVLAKLTGSAQTTQLRRYPACRLSGLGERETDHDGAWSL